MTKETAIERLCQIENDLKKGKAHILRSINKRKSFLMKYMATDNIPKLFVKETLYELEKIKGKS